MNKDIENMKVWQQAIAAFKQYGNNNEKDLGKELHQAVNKLADEFLAALDVELSLCEAQAHADGGNELKYSLAPERIPEGTTHYSFSDDDWQFTYWKHDTSTWWYCVGVGIEWEKLHRDDPDQRERIKL